MKSKFFKFSLLATLCTLFLQTPSYAQTAEAQDVSWNEKLETMLPYLGHRNWILVVDAAYPLQSSRSVETIVVDEDIDNVAKQVLKYLDKAEHVTPIVYQDKEFAYMKSVWCRNSERLYSTMKRIIAPYEQRVILHDEIFEKIDSASQMFNVLVIKTNCEIPYSSLFIELDCGYWDAESEAKLRNSMK